MSRPSSLLMLMLMLLPVCAHADHDLLPEDYLFTDDITVEKPGTSSVKLSLAAGNNGYRLITLEPALELAPEWLVVGKLAHIRSAPRVVTDLFEAGARWLRENRFSLEATAAGGAGPSPLDSAGGNARAALWLNRLWSGRPATILRLEGSYTDYSLPPRPSGVRPHGNQWSVLFGLRQDLTRDLRLGVAYTFFDYSVAVATLNAFIARTRLTFPGLAGTVAGFPQDIFAFELFWGFARSWDLEATLTSTSTETTGERTTGITGCVTKDLGKNWALGLRGSGNWSPTTPFDWSLGPELEAHW